MSASPGSRGPAWVPAALVAAAGLTLTAAAFVGTRRLEATRLDSQFREQAGQPVAALQRSIALYTEDLQSIGQLYAASRLVERDEFRAFVEGILSRRLAVQALVWAPRVVHSERAAFEADLFQNHLSDVGISYRDEKGRTAPVAEHEAYYPVRFVQPAPRDERLVGLDLGADPDYHDTLQQACATGQPRTTSRVTFGQASRTQSTVAFVLPIYQHDMPQLAGPALRRESLLGFAVGVFGLDDLVAEAVGRSMPAGIRLEVWDEPSASGRELLCSYPKVEEGAPGRDPARPQEGSRSRRRHTAGLIAPGRQWLAVCRPTPGYLASSRAWGAWGVLVIGLLFTGLSAAYVRTLTGRAAWADRLVRERTAELSQTNEQLHREMAERERHERALRDSEERYRLLVQMMNDGLSVLDEGGRLSFVNEALCRMLGYAAEEILGRSPSELLDEENQAILEEQMTRRRKGEDKPYELVYTTKSGGSVHTIVSPRSLRDASGFHGSFAVITDITRLKQSQAELARALAEVRRSNAELESFAYVASHDLQEPLRKIRAFGDRLEAKSGAALDARGRDYLDRMRNAAARMQALIDGLLSFSRVTTRGEPFVPVSLTQVAREVVSDLETRIEQVGGRVEVGDLPTIDADPLQMRQLLQNLIGNALKFRREEEPPVVQVRGETGPSATPGATPSGVPGPVCRLTVEDNGIGIDMAHADRIFGVFQRLHGRTEYEGTGVGLAICRKIAERHGGTIAVEGVPGSGSTFLVTLPVHQPQGGNAP